MKIDLEALETLDAIVRLGSFGAAAKALHKVPSALTYTISKLEDSFDVTLFDRSGHRAKLTEKGEYVLEQGRYLLEAAQNLERRLHQAQHGWESEIKIAVDVLISQSAILQLIEQFYQLKQDTKVTLSLEVFGGTWDALETGRADLVIGASGASPNTQFQVIPMGVLDRVLAVTPNHPLAKVKVPITQEMLLQYRAVSMSDTSRVLKPKTAPHLKTQPILSVPNMSFKIMAQEMGLGIGFLATKIAQDLQRKGTLMIKEVETSSSPMLQAIYHREEKGKALQWFVGELKKKSWVDQLLAK